MAISVRCLGPKQCAYQLKIDREDVDMSVKQFAAAATTFTPKPPGTILASDYVNGRLDTAKEVKYYYFPIDYEVMTEAVILLNKT